MKYNIVRMEECEGRLVAVFDYEHDAIEHARLLTLKTGLYHLIEVVDGGKH